jgi:regulator of cell morphogenesis and NO signaling
MPFDVHTSVGQIVVEKPRLSQVFDRLGIDYCCRGSTSLSQACDAGGLDVADVLREITAFIDKPVQESPLDPARLTSSALADHIVNQHHAFLRSILPALAAQLDKVVSVHAEHHPELRDVREVFLALKDELELHMMKEEKVLFPLIKELESATTLPSIHCGSVNNPIRVMVMEHADAGEALTRLRDLTGAFTVPDDACSTYRAVLRGLAELEADLHQHIHKENNILFPRAVAMEAALRTGS